MMTVREIIRELQRFPKDEVMTFHSGNSWFTLESISGYPMTWQEVRETKAVIEFRNPAGKIIFRQEKK